MENMRTPPLLYISRVYCACPPCMSANKVSSRHLTVFLSSVQRWRASKWYFVLFHHIIDEQKIECERLETWQQLPLAQIEQLTLLFCDFFATLICFISVSLLARAGKTYWQFRCEPKSVQKFFSFLFRRRHLSLGLSRERTSKQFIIYFGF